jgi:antitoxin MazE
VKTTIVRIGNSQGVRIPKAILGSAKVGDAVDMEAAGDRIVLRFAPSPRAAWAVAARRMAAAGDDTVGTELAAPRTDWDEENWTW